jgi:arsenate reductase (glutaredoxin)
MQKTVIYHNPRCSHSRQSLALLEQQGYQPKVIEYLLTPPSVTELKKIIKMLQIKPRELMRSKEKEYLSLHLDDPKLSEAALIQAMHDYPILIQRPIVVIDNRACIGRPAENILTIM